MSLIKTAFKYYAKFPTKESVLANFINDSSEITPGYADFKTEIENLTEHSVIPQITDYVFGVDETTVKQKISKIEGIYIFLDYGAIYTEKDHMQRKSSELLLALNVARPMNPNNTDFIEEVLLADQLLEYIVQIRNKMIEDQQNNPFVKELSFPHEITPFYSRELSNSVGWTMIFKKTGIDIL